MNGYTKRFEYHECIFRGERREMILFKKFIFSLNKKKYARTILYTRFVLYS